MKRLQITIEDDNIYKCFLIAKQLCKNITFDQEEGIEFNSDVRGNIHIYQGDIPEDPVEEEDVGGFRTGDIIEHAKRELNIDMSKEKADECLDWIAQKRFDPTVGMNWDQLEGFIEEFMELENE